jgi:(2Fe-2S) ferredoxin
MPMFTHHVMICGNRRAEGHSRGSCDRTGSEALRNAFKKELRNAGFGQLARANHAGCLDQCEHGPVVVVYPQGIWYGNVTVDDVPRIVAKTLLGGEILTDLAIEDSCLNNPGCPHRGGRAETARESS